MVEQLVCICVADEQWLFNETADVPAAEWNGADQLWHKLSIEIAGDHLMVFRDNILIFEHFDSAISEMPKIGHIHLSNTYQETCFDDVMMTSISGPAYICGDANADQAVNVSDAVNIVNYVFIGGTAPDPIEAGDSNCDSTVNISDAVWIINYIFIGGNPPCDTNGNGMPDC